MNTNELYMHSKKQSDAKAKTSNPFSNIYLFLHNFEQELKHDVKVMLTFLKRNPIKKGNKLILKHFGRMMIRFRLINLHKEQVVFYSSDIYSYWTNIILVRNQR